MKPAQIAQLRTALALAYEAGITLGLRTLIRAIWKGVPVDLILVKAAIRAMARKTWTITDAMYRGQFKIILGGDFRDYTALEQILLERKRLHYMRMNDYSHLYQDAARQAMSIGRRGQDIIRELTLNTLEQGMIGGKPATLQRNVLVKAMLDKGKPALADAIRAGADPRAEILKSVPVFDVDGKPHFYLKTKTGAYKAFSVEGYADLVSTTTSEEADRVAQPERAKAMGTRLVKFNSTGKGRQFYLKTNDLRCAAVDGQTFSIEPSGTLVNGQMFQYWREALPGEYVTCHPYCQHFMRPISEALV